MSKSVLVDKRSSRGHCCYFYKDQNDRKELLASFFKTGIEKNELCIFVTSNTKEQIMSDYEKSAPFIIKAIKTKSLLVFEMNSTYMPNGQFAANYMLKNVKLYIEEAKKRGFKGLRTAGEMKWVIDNHGESEGAILYEQKVNTLNEPKPNFVGLCLYPSDGLSDELTDGVLRSHPTIIQQGSIKNNPLYAN